ncbi:psbP domain-containing protein 2, chloroplastic [Diospyros lotus]|uniref:psbP domain-containing protein 2, chloroplastic n=1 Tax=Diospyros lotus TaxID=55363 RepID=UPI00225027A1|nr:psbP domain-containing protein 2, chloroplastic [Diospyros lotus]
MASSSSVCFLSSTTRRLFVSVSHCSSSSSSSSFAQRPRRESSDISKGYRTICLGKRMLSLSVAAIIFSSSSIPTLSKATADDLELQRYTDLKEGFTLLLPPSWIKVDKAGATLLFEEPNKAANNIGVVVNPVRLTKLEEFGSPEFVADKLIQAEKRKESTKDAEVIEASQRLGNGGLQVYEFEYKVDSTRGGMKRIFSAAFVASKKLYVLNIAHSDKPESPLDTGMREILEQVLHSFDTITTPMA